MEEGDIFGECGIGFSWDKKGGFSKKRLGSSVGLKGSGGFGAGAIGSGGSAGCSTGSGAAGVSGTGMLGLTANRHNVDFKIWQL